MSEKSRQVDAFAAVGAQRPSSKLAELALNERPDPSRERIIHIIQLVLRPRAKPPAHKDVAAD